MNQSVLFELTIIKHKAVFYHYLGGFRFFTLENMILSYGLGVKAWSCTHNLSVVLGPCAQCFSCEASEQKMVQKPTAKRKELKLSFLHYSICLDELIILVVRMLKSDKNGRVMPIQSWGKMAFWPILGRQLVILDMYFEILTSNWVCQSITLILSGKPIWKSIGPKLTND